MLLKTGKETILYAQWDRYTLYDALKTQMIITKIDLEALTCLPC